MKIPFTDASIRNLKPSAKTYDCIAEKEPGFGIRVLPSGTLTFFYLYKIDGQKRFLNLGNYPSTSLKEARGLYESNKVKVKELRRGSADGSDPVEIKRAKREGRIKASTDRKDAPTVSELIQDYLTRYIVPEKPKSAPEYRRILEKELESWFKKKIMDIKDSDVETLTDSIIDRGSPGMARNTHQVIRAMFNWAIKRTTYKKFMPESPCKGLGIPVKPKKRKRSLKPEEIKMLWDSLDKCMMSEQVKIIIKISLLTAQRSGEVCGLSTSEISGDWWTISAERAKNGNPHRVFLTPSVKSLIAQAIEEVMRVREMPPESKYEGFIFPCPHWKVEKDKPIARHAVSIAVARNFIMPVVDEKGKPKKDKSGNPVTESRFGFSETFVPHDIRRTASGLMAWAGVQHEDRERVLNHTLGELDETYVQFDFDERKKEALLKLESKVMELVS
jgi:integrase